MRWVYLSPHFDDVVLSCGGLVWEQVQAGQAVEIWTVCAGESEPGGALSDFAKGLHARWETGPEAVAVRHAEDEAAIRRLGAVLRTWDLPDCIYRRLPSGAWLVNGEADLWKALPEAEAGTVERLSGWIASHLRKGDQVVSPMTLGNHVDHQLVRAAAELAQTALWYYADYPYAVRTSGDSAGNTAGKLNPEWEKVCFPVSRDGLAAWQDAIACYASQLSTFWGGLTEMQSAIETYWQSGGGTCLWRNHSR